MTLLLVFHGDFKQQVSYSEVYPNPLSKMIPSRALKIGRIVVMSEGFIKSTDHRPTTTDSPTHRPTDPIIILKRPDSRKILVLKKTNLAVKIILAIIYLMNSISLFDFEYLQMKI